MPRLLDATSPDRRRRVESIVLVGLVVLPIVVLIVVLAQRTWYPTGDLAQAELRMRSLPRHPPLIGAAGRITDEAGRQGNHPGPLMFWATWPLYALLGGSSWAFEAATALVNAFWLGLSVWLVRRRTSLAVTGWFAVVALVLVGGFGLDALSQPWNPWVALLPFTALVVAAWRALDGWRWAPVVGVAAASYSIQGHAGYAPVALPLVAVTVVAPLVAAWRANRSPELADADDGDGASDGTGWHPRRLAGLLGLALVTGLVAWSGPFLDIWRNTPSNLSKLIANFGSPSEPPVGLAEGARTVLRALSPVGPWVKGGVLVEGSVLPGLALVLVWMVVAVAIARVPERRREHRALVELDAIVGLCLLTATYGVSRIFGEPYLYVFRWITVIAAFVVFTVGWGLAILVAERWRPATLPRAVSVAAVAILLFSIFTSGRVARQGIPYPYSWRMERVLAPEVADGLDHRPRYLVDWDDTVYLGGLGFGLLLDLEKRGFDVGAKPQYSAAIEPQRVRCPGDYDAVLTVVTGPTAIARWKAKPGTHLLASVGPVPGFDYEATFDRLRTVMAKGGKRPSAAALEGALTLILLNPGAPAEAPDLASALVSNGVPSAVFLQDPAPLAPPVPLEGPYEPCWK